MKAKAVNAIAANTTIPKMQRGIGLTVILVPSQPVASAIMAMEISNAPVVVLFGRVSLAVHVYFFRCIHCCELSV